MLQSLDYELCESKIFKEEQARKSGWSLNRQNATRWMVMFLIGVCTAFVACLIDISVAEISKLKYGFLKQSRYYYCV